MPGGGVSGMTDHPLTEYRDAEITDEMVEAGASYAWEKANPGARYWDSLSASHKEGCRRDARAVLAAALAVAPTDSRPWEPLKKGDPLAVGDEVRRESLGLTTTAVVGRVDKSGELWTAEGAYLGLLRYDTWYVRRAVQELPTQGGTVLIPADGREYIEMDVEGQTYYAREALLANGRWNAIWRTATGDRVRYSAQPEEITPGTWKVDER